MINLNATKRMSADERREVFSDQFNHDIELDAGYTLARLVRGAGDYLARIVGEDSATAGMTAMLHSLVGQEATGDWREDLSGCQGVCCASWPLGEMLTTLSAYAYFGVLFQGAPNEPEMSDEERLELLVNYAQDFLQESPLEMWVPDEDLREPLVRLILLARNRWALDNGQPIEPKALALFGGVTEARIRNMMSGSDARFTGHDGKKIPAQQALSWLADRDTYLDSIWREESKTSVLHMPDPIDAPLFVPVARDGSIFHPGLARDHGFTIGPKGAERQVADFYEALAELQRMPIPYWRRPNDKRRMGIVRGVHWERHDLDSLALRGC